MTNESDGAPRIWTPDARIIDPRDFKRRHRRQRRHGGERSQSVPMPAAIRTIDDVLALKITPAELRAAWGQWIDAAAAWIGCAKSLFCAAFCAER